MRITNIKNINNDYINSQKQIYFKAHYDYGQVKEITGDGIRYSRGFIHNYSCLLRTLELFFNIPALLKKNFPNGVKIYDYGCSVGYEPVSVDLGLHNFMSANEIAKYTPIYARDNNSSIIKMAKKYRLRLDDDEIYRLSLLENIKQEDFFNIRRKGKDGQKIYDYKNILKKEILYEEADIFDDLDKKNLWENPCIIMLCNTWQFMTNKGKDELAQKLYKNLKPKSIVIVGDKDLYSGVKNYLIKHQFEPIQSSNITPKNMNKRFLSDEYSVDYCFEHK